MNGPLEQLVHRLSPDRTPARHILVGQAASGKSSELTKLASELQQRYNTLVVRLDITQNTSFERVNPVEVLLLMGTAVFKVARSELPKAEQPDRKLLEKLKKSLETIVTSHTEDKGFKLDLDRILTGLVVFGGAALAGPVGAAAGLTVSGPVVESAQKVAERMLSFRLSSGTSVEVVRKLEVQPQVEAMIDNVNAIIEDVRLKAGRPLVLLIDGLDKLRDTEVIRLNFLDNKYLDGPICSVLYTGPPELYYQAEFGGVRARYPLFPFSHVKLRQQGRDGQAYGRGRDFMKEVVRRRFESVGAGLGQSVSRSALDLLVRGSGGVMRDLIRLVQSAALQAEISGAGRIERASAAKAVNELRRQLMAQLTPKYQGILKEVRQSQQRTEDPECDLMLRNDLVLVYFNEDVWFDVHAALTDEPW